MTIVVKVAKTAEVKTWRIRGLGAKSCDPLCPPAVSQPPHRGGLLLLSAGGVPPSGAPAGQAARGGSGNQSARVMEPKPLARSHIYYRSTRPTDCHSLGPTYISNKYNLENHTNTTNESKDKGSNAEQITHYRTLCPPKVR